jgi:hypothetical protein
MAQNIRMPDGKVVAFPDDMPQEEIKALIENKYPEARPEMRAASKASGKLKGKVDELPSRQPPKKTLASEAVDYTSQGMSGINEGIANVLGAPADLTTAAINLGIGGVNAATGGDIGYIEDPAFGAQSWKDRMTNVGAVKAPSDDPGKQIVRRIGEEVGSAIIPGIGMASKAAKPAAVIGNTLKTAVGSGAGAAVAEQVAPGNIWAEIAGQLAGGGVGSVVGAGKKVPKAPSADELQQLKRDAYKAVDNLGASYIPQALDKLASNIATATAKASSIRHPKAVSMVQDIKSWVANGMSLTELDELRQRVRLDLIRSGDEAEGMWGEAILDEIDNFIAKAGAADMASGSGPDANKAILAARELNSRWRKTELIEDAYYKAHMQTESTGSGGNINNKIKQALTSILTNEKKRRAFTTAELDEMEKVVSQGKGDDLLRLVGKLSPSGNGLMAALGIGGTAANPLLAAVPIAGMIAKGAADASTVRKAATLRANIAAGKGNTLRSADRGLATSAAALGGATTAAANDNERRTNTLRLNAFDGVL